MQTRRSMVFAKHLRLIGDDFRAKYLNSTDNRDHTVYNEDWTRMKVSQCIWLWYDYVIVQVELSLRHLRAVRFHCGLEN